MKTEGDGGQARVTYRSAWSADTIVNELRGGIILTVAVLDVEMDNEDLGEREQASKLAKLLT